MIENKFAKKVVEAIQLGLKRAKIAEMENGDRFNNAKSSKIIDKMMSSLYSSLSLDERLEVFEFYRFYSHAHRLLSFHIMPHNNRKYHGYIMNCICV